MSELLHKKTLKQQFHNKTITYNGESSIQDILTAVRRSNLLDKSKSAEINKQILEKKGILFLPNTVHEFHEKDSNGKMVYRLLLIGILPDGRKTSVIIEDIVPYFEVRKPKNLTEHGFRKKISAIVKEKARNSFIKEVRAKGFNRYEKDTALYLRIHFYNIWDRKRVLKYFMEYLPEYETTTDDTNHYERAVCRNTGFSLCAWNSINFTSYKKEDICVFDKTFRVKICDINEYTGDITKNDSLAFDKTIVKTWDIEAYTDKGEMPNPENTDDVVFAIGQTYHWKYSKESIIDICLITQPCDPRPDKLTIYCTSEVDLIKASFLLDKYLRPDFIIGFNDGDFDWKFVITKALMYGCLVYIYDSLNVMTDWRLGKQTKKERETSILKWECRKQKVKLEADTDAYSTTMIVPGIINIDVRTIFRKLHPTEPKSSLKFYLKLHNLGGKEDMPIHTMFNIFKESMLISEKVNTLLNSDSKVLPDTVKSIMTALSENKKKMADVAHYCLIDAKRCQELIHKVNVISDKREVSNVSHTSLYDAIYYADGMKVRNLVISESQKRGYLLSTRSKEFIGSGKYPGAYVFPPVQGPVKPKLSIRERHSIATDETQENDRVDNRWGKVPESDIALMEDAIYKCMGTEDRKDNTTHEYVADNTEFTYDHSKELFVEFLKEQNKYPIFGLDFSSLYPSIIMTYNLTPEYMLFSLCDKETAENDGHTTYKIEFEFNGQKRIAWSIRHDTIDGKTLQEGKTENKFGMYPTILKSLFDKRTQMKKGLKKFAKEKEAMEKKGLQNTKEYAKICFSYNYINAKQKALKVFMNTFYGETGNKLSPFFVLEIAGGITSAGQRNIKMIADLVRANGYRVYYGDTDSVYISCPDRCFIDIDRKYYSGKIDKTTYCTQLVKETFVQSEVGKNMANSALIADNNTKFLKMAYEEVLFPAIFLLRKMYAGVEHQSIVNFHPHGYELFTRGLALKKRGTSDVLKKVCTEVLLSILDIKNTKSVLSIIKDKIKEVYTRKWEIEDFKKDAVYKPKKQNVSVHTFYNRMNERNDPDCPVPSPGERFYYVVVRKYPYKYDIKGRKSYLKVSEKWEYYSYAKKKGLEIDLHYYMEGGIIGQFSQLIVFYDRFKVQPTDDSEEAQSTATKKALLNSKKYITAMCKNIANFPVCQGPVLKQLYTIAKTTCDTIAFEEDDEDSDYIIDVLSPIDIYQSMRDSIKEDVKPISEAYAVVYTDHMIKKFGKDVVFTLLKMYKGKTGFLSMRHMYTIQVEDSVKDELYKNSDKIKKIFTQKETTIKELISIMKKGLGMDNMDDVLDRDRPLTTNSVLSNNIVQDVIHKRGNECVSYKTLVHNQIEMRHKILDIYTRLYCAIEYQEEARAIIERVQYLVDKRQQENPPPPTVNKEEIMDASKDFIRENLIEF